MNEILYNNLSWDEYLLGDKLGLRYTEFIPILIKSIQELSTQNKHLQQRVLSLEATRGH